MSSIATPFPTLWLRRSFDWLIGPGVLFMFVILLCVTLTLSGCIFGSFANFVSVAEADLPVVVQMISNITTIIAPGVSPAIAAGGALAVSALVLACGNPVKGSAKCDPTSLVGQYQANPSATLLGKIQQALSTATSHVTDMLALAKGLPQNVAASIATALSIALATVTSIISLIPVGMKLLANRRATLSAAEKRVLQTIPHPKELRARFDAATNQWPSAAI